MVEAEGRRTDKAERKAGIGDEAGRPAVNQYSLTQKQGSKEDWTSADLELMAVSHIVSDADLSWH